VCVTAEIVGSGGESEQAVQQSEEMAGLASDSDWHALSQKEETDLDTIMSQCEFAISNAEKFADQLSRDLSVLDGVLLLLLLLAAAAAAASSSSSSSSSRYYY